MTVAFTNFASTTLAGGITAGATSLTLTTTTGANFPSTAGGAWFYVVLTDSLIVPTQREIIKVTTRAGDTCSVCVRARDGTVAQAWPSGTYVQLRLTQGTFADLTVQYANNADNLSNLASAATARTNLGLGTMATQAASAVAVTGGTLDAVTVTNGALNGTLGAATPSTVAATAIATSGVITSTLATGTAPFTVASTTQVANLNVTQLVGSTWLIPDRIGGTTPNNGSFTVLSANTMVSGAGFSNYLASPPAIGGSVPAAGSFTAGTFTTVRATVSINMRGLDNASATNSGFGEGVLAALAGGTGNTAVGNSALAAATTGSSNTAAGRQALLGNTTGGTNVAVGMLAMSANTSGDSNVAVGYQALQFIKTSTYNVAAGYQAMKNFGAAIAAGSFIIGVSYTIATAGSTVFTTIGAADNNPGTNFTATGVGAGTGTATPNVGGNIGIGTQTLTSTTSGFYNTGVGYGGLLSNQTGNYNIGVGYLSVPVSVLCSQTVGIGRNAFVLMGASETAGAFASGQSYTILTLGSTDFTLIGAALNNVGVVFTATGVGVGTGTAAPNAHNNVGVGDSVGATLVRGANNTLVGTSANVTSANQTNSTAVGYQATATADNQVLLGNPSVTTTVLRGQVTVPAIKTTIVRKTANYTALATDTTILCDTSGGAFTVTLEASPSDGHIVNIKKITTDANVLTIGRNTKSIEGAAADLTTALTTRPNFQLQYELANTTWWIL